MLNLLRVELAKLLRGKLFWITVLVYLVSVTSTFIPLSYAPDIAAVAESADQWDYLDEMLDSWGEELDQANEILVALHGEANFIQQFYATSSGQNVIALIVVTVFIFLEFTGGTLRNVLLCGYSRTRVYLAKLGAGIVGSWVFLAMAMAVVLWLGCGFYGMVLGGEALYSALLTFLGQCAMAVELVCVFTAFAFAMGNGWALLASTAFFTVLQGGPILAAYMGGRDEAFLTTVVPTLVSLVGFGRFVSMDQMLAAPQLWTGGFLAVSALVWVVLCVSSTLVGLRVFHRRQL